MPGKHEADAAQRPRRLALQRLLDALIFLEHLGRDRGAGLAQRGLEVGHRHLGRVEPAAKRGQAGAADEVLEVGAGEALGPLRDRFSRSTSSASGMSSVWIARMRRRPAVSGTPT